MEVDGTEKDPENTWRGRELPTGGGIHTEAVGWPLGRNGGGRGSPSINRPSGTELR